MAQQHADPGLSFRCRSKSSPALATTRSADSSIAALRLDRLVIVFDIVDGLLVDRIIEERRLDFGFAFLANHLRSRLAADENDLPNSLFAQRIEFQLHE